MKKIDYVIIKIDELRQLLYLINTIACVMNNELIYKWKNEEAKKKFDELGELRQHIIKEHNAQISKDPKF